MLFATVSLPLIAFWLLQLEVEEANFKLSRSWCLGEETLKQPGLSDQDIAVLQREQELLEASEVCIDRAEAKILLQHGAVLGAVAGWSSVDLSNAEGPGLHRAFSEASEVIRTPTRRWLPAFSLGRGRQALMQI